MLKVFYDGECPFCRREMAWLMRRVPEGAVDFVNTATLPEGAVSGKTLTGLSEQIHAQTAEGEWVTGVEVFRRLYRAAGLGWVLAWTAWPLMRPLSDYCYRVFARNRLRWGGYFNRLFPEKNR